MTTVIWVESDATSWENTWKVPKDEPMLKIAIEKENSDARRTAVVEDLFAKFEKQSSTKVV